MRSFGMFCDGKVQILLKVEDVGICLSRTQLRNKSLNKDGFSSKYALNAVAETQYLRNDVGNVEAASSDWRIEHLALRSNAYRFIKEG